MRKLAGIIIRTLCLAVLFSTPAFAQFPAMQLPEGPFVRATLISDVSTIEVGKPFHAAVLLDATEGWHTYWQNPGDAGLPTTLKWTLPEGFSASDIDWPLPELIREGPLVVYGYHGKTLLPVTITPPQTLPTDNTLKVQASWLVCKDICIPESQELELILPTSKFGENILASVHRDRFLKHYSERPTPLSATATADTKNIVLNIILPVTDPVTSVYFFPRAQGLISYNAEQKVEISNQQLSITLERAEDHRAGDVTGLLKVTTETGDTLSYDLSFNVPIAPMTAAASSAPTATPTLALMLAFAFLGGLILNLMPCVLPVLSLKALAIAKKADKEHSHVLRLGIAYTTGVVLSFLALAGLLIALKAGGESVGWGYQMQSPAFVGFLVYLLFLVGLNLSGLFELPVLLGSFGSGLANESSTRGSFFTGVLAAAVATPCTAPFMATAVGVALTLPALQSLMVFASLGFGLASPFLLVSVFPRMLRFLPKPGAWMDTFKHLLALPMYASVLWLLWVLSMQTGMAGISVALTGMVFILLAIAMKRQFPEGSPRYRTSAMLLLAATVVISLPALNSLKVNSVSIPFSHNVHGVETVLYSRETLEKLRAEGKPVFLDATAAWCITCQVNSRLAIHTNAVMGTFRDQGITFMIADWTLYNQEITELLASFGFQGVPMYVYYPANGEPEVLPQVLTESIILEAVRQ